SVTVTDVGFRPELDGLFQRVIASWNQTSIYDTNNVIPFGSWPTKESDDRIAAKNQLDCLLFNPLRNPVPNGGTVADAFMGGGTQAQRAARAGGAGASDESGPSPGVPFRYRIPLWRLVPWYQRAIDLQWAN